MNAVSIKPITVPKKGIGTKMIVGVYSYKLLNSNITCFCSILSDTNNVLIKSKNIKIPIDIYDSWKGDDMKLIDYVSQTQLVDVIEKIEIVQQDKKDKRSEELRINDSIRKSIKKRAELMKAENLEKISEPSNDEENVI